mgnify:FL=1
MTENDKSTPIVLSDSGLRVLRWSLVIPVAIGAFGATAMLSYLLYYIIPGVDAAASGTGDGRTGPTIQAVAVAAFIILGTITAPSRRPVVAAGLGLMITAWFRADILAPQASAVIHEPAVARFLETSITAATVASLVLILRLTKGIRRK